jgi:hypothetical protein
MDAECGIIADAAEEDGVLASTGRQEAGSEGRSSDGVEGGEGSRVEGRVEEDQVVDRPDFVRVAMEIRQM